MNDFFIFILNIVSVLLWISWQILLVYFWATYIKKLVSISDLKKKSTTFYIKSFLVFICSTIFSFILGVVFLMNISSVCILDAWATWGNCGDAMWGMFLFILLSPILSLLSLILWFIYGKNKKNFPYQNTIDFFFFVLVIFSLIFFHFLQKATQNVLS